MLALYRKIIIAEIDIFKILYCINCNTLAKLNTFFYSKPPNLINPLFNMDRRYKQANKEAKLSLLLTLIYFAAWIISAYTVKDQTGFIGLPLWFELSCIMVPLGFILLCYIVVKKQFKNIPLE